MEPLKEEVRVRGKARIVDAISVDGKVVVSTGKLIRVAAVKDEWTTDVEDPEAIIEALRTSGLHADLFTFAQRLPETTPKHGYFMSWDNVAAIPLTTFDHWWRDQITQEARNKVRKARKSGVETRLSKFDHDLMKSIHEICNETPIRQGAPFWHYGKDLETLTRIHETYLDRADFVCAYYGDELIGFIKLVGAGAFIRTFHVLTRISHRDKAPTNAMIAEAVRVCCEKRAPYLVYGQYDYGKLGSQGLTNFKRENGFQRLLLPRYYVPLTLRGHWVVRSGLHRGIAQALPERMVRLLRELRNRWYANKFRSVQRRATF